MNLPDGATWEDYLAAHGGLDAVGWWIILYWDTDAEAIGPYATQEIAMSAMEDSNLINGICEDTNAPAVLEDVYVAAGPLSIAQVLMDYRRESDNQPLVTLIDPAEPDHFGGIS